MPGDHPVNLWALADLSTPWCVHVVSTLRIAEHMNGGIDRIENLAAASQCDAGSLQRVLRHLIGAGVFQEPEPGRFTLNEAARGLLDPALQIGLDLDSFGGRMANAWNSLLTAVRTGAPAYDTVFGRPFWDDLQANPTIAAAFDDLMGPAGHGAPDGAIPFEGGWQPVRTVVDVGGGTGALLAAVLREHPGVHGTLVDLPSTVARSGRIFRDAGVSSRVTTAGQSFFDPLPSGADVYLIKNVLSDWPDVDASRILARCAEAARPNGRVVVVNGVSADDRGAAPPELLMMVLVGGKARTLEEFRTLARGAGLDVVATARRDSRLTVECRPLA